ncbi:MAG: hypothetical protein PVG30_09110 [Gammaproteobacteria bacterium]|jgi:hypothetical protein
MTQEADLKPENKNKKKENPNGRGGKLNRSEIVHLRLNPRTRFALELMARNENRTVSSFLEILVNEAMAVKKINMFKLLEEIQQEQGGVTPKDVHGYTDMNTKNVNLTEALKELWHVKDYHRFILLCFFAPHLLTYEEELIWEFIKKANYYWPHYYVKAVDMDGVQLGKTLTRVFDSSSVIWDRIERHWELLKNLRFQEIIDSLEKNKESIMQGKIIPVPEGESDELILYRTPEGFIGVEKQTE